jgi:hypothetical protein
MHPCPSPFLPCALGVRHPGIVPNRADFQRSASLMHSFMRAVLQKLTSNHGSLLLLEGKSSKALMFAQQRPPYSEPPPRPA